MAFSSLIKKMTMDPKLAEDRFSFLQGKKAAPQFSEVCLTLVEDASQPKGQVPKLLKSIGYKTRASKKRGTFMDLWALATSAAETAQGKKKQIAAAGGAELRNGLTLIIEIRGEGGFNVKSGSSSSESDSSSDSESSSSSNQSLLQEDSVGSEESVDVSFSGFKAAKYGKGCTKRWMSVKWDKNLANKVLYMVDGKVLIKSDVVVDGLECKDQKFWNPGWNVTNETMDQKKDAVAESLKVSRGTAGWSLAIAEQLFDVTIDEKMFKNQKFKCMSLSN